MAEFSSQFSLSDQKEDVAQDYIPQRLARIKKSDASDINEKKDPNVRETAHSFGYRSVMGINNESYVVNMAESQETASEQEKTAACSGRDACGKQSDTETAKQDDRVSRTDPMSMVTLSCVRDTDTTVTESCVRDKDMMFTESCVCETDTKAAESYVRDTLGTDTRHARKKVSFQIDQSHTSDIITGTVTNARQAMNEKPPHNNPITVPITVVNNTACSDPGDSVSLKPERMAVCPAHNNSTSINPDGEEACTSSKDSTSIKPDRGAGGPGPRDSMRTQKRKVHDELLKIFRNRQNLVDVSEVNFPAENLLVEHQAPNTSLRRRFIRRNQSLNRDFQLINASRLDPRFLDVVNLPLDDLHVANNVDIPEEMFIWGEQRPVIATYPQGERKFTECRICYDLKELHLRVCCSFSACDDCHMQYFTTQVMQGNTKIQCPDPKCKHFVHRDEILARLSGESKEKFYKFLVDANKDPNVKTCPRCSHIMSVSKNTIPKVNNANQGMKVVCPECDLVWCFPCHAPWHEGVSCKEYVSGDKLLRSWAKEFHYGQQNAQKCPKCKVFIQRTTGCDHMICVRCSTSFCYRCGERFRTLKFVGDHYSKLSILGCKYRFKPDKPAQRKFIRGSIFGGKIAVAPVLGAFAVGVGAVLLAVGTVVLPFYGGYKIHKKRKQKKHLKKRLKKRREDLRKHMEIIRARDEVEGFEIISHPLSISKSLDETDIASRNIFDEMASDYANSADFVCMTDDPHLSMTVRLNMEEDSSSESSDSEDDCDVTVTEVKVITESVKDKGVAAAQNSEENKPSQQTLCHHHFKPSSYESSKCEKDTATLELIMEDTIKIVKDMSVMEAETTKESGSSKVKDTEVCVEHINENDESTAL